MYGQEDDLEAFASDGQIDTASIFSQVLLVEDETAHAKLISRALAGVVGEVEHVNSGAKALDSVKSSYYELVLCDLHLPDMSGLEIMRAIREIRPSLPIIVLTSSSRLEDAIAAMKEGAWDYMVKQFSEDLQGRMRIVISNAALRRADNLRALQVRTERDSFWVAARTALDGLAILGTEGSVVFANEVFRNFCSALKRENVEPAGLNVVELIQERSEHVARELQAQFSRGGGDSLWSSELRIDEGRPDGEKQERYFELTLSSAKLAELEDVNLGLTGISDLRRYVLWTRDITRRKEQERFQRDLLSTTSHDLKGPLGAILTSAELLTDGIPLDSSKAQDLLTRVASCARNSITIIDELLSARRIQDGVLVVTPKWYELEEILEDIKLDYLMVAKAKSIAFTLKPLPEGLRVYADKVALNRVLSNLVSNAIKFTPKGGSVQLAAERHGNEVRISVEDTGPGIESEARHILFERYARLEKHSNVEGTGLGLYVTKNIIDAHNGTIRVDSKLNEGTKFIVSFPDPAG